MKTKRLPLSATIFIALGLGILAGLCFTGSPAIAVTYIKPLGTIFLNLIKFIVVPIVFCSIVTGILSMRDIRKVGSIGVKTVLYYFCTTAVALVIALTLASAFQGLFPVLDTSDLSYEVTNTTTLMGTLVSIFPSNIISPFAEAAMLQVIVAALLFGFAMISVKQKGEPLAAVISSANDVCMKIMEFIIGLSPIGVFCLITPVVAENGPSILGALGLVLDRKSVV